MDFYPTTSTASIRDTSTFALFDWFWLASQNNGPILHQLDHLIPYAIITINFILFKLLRSFVNKIVAYYTTIDQHYKPSHISNSNASGSKSIRKVLSSSAASSSSSSSGSTNDDGGNKYKYIKLLKLFIDELVSTCELCTNCAELNVVYEKHGSLAYGLSLFILTYLWMDAFGEAHTTPGYLIEDYFLINGSQTLKTGSTYARFIGQSLAMPMAWRLASLYWNYKLLGEHKEMLIVDNCKSALSTSTPNGFLIEFICCMLCRLIELYGHRMLENGQVVSQRLVSLTTSFLCTSLVVMALELSGGYFNPILASSLEFGCKGANNYQHALVFWLGPLAGHVTARALYRWSLALGEQEQQVVRKERNHLTSGGGGGGGGQASQLKKLPDGPRQRLTRSSSQRKKNKKHSD